MLLKEASYYRQVVLKVPGQPGGNVTPVLTWDDQPDIRNARTIGMEIYFANDLGFSQPNGIAVVPDSLANLITFRFETNDPDDIDYKQKGRPGNFTGTLNTIQWLPATALHRSQSFGIAPAPYVRDMTMWKNRYIIWQKSDVWITGGLKNTTDLAIVLGVYYSFLTAEGKEITR